MDCSTHRSERERDAFVERRSHPRPSALRPELHPTRTGEGRTDPALVVHELRLVAVVREREHGGDVGDLCPVQEVASDEVPPLSRGRSSDRPRLTAHLVKEGRVASPVKEQAQVAGLKRRVRGHRHRV